MKISTDNSVIRYAFGDMESIRLVAKSITDLTKTRINTIFSRRQRTGPSLKKQKKCLTGGI